MGGMKYGYVRVSPDDESAAQQLAALKRVGCKTLFRDDGLSKTTTKRPELERCLKMLRRGDTLVVWKLDRLELRLCNLVTQLLSLRKRGIKFQSVVNRAAGRAVWQRIGDLLELDRRCLRTERIRAGFSAALCAAMKSGRRANLTPQQIGYALSLFTKHELLWLPGLCKVKSKHHGVVSGG